MSRLFVGNLAFSVNENDLMQLFSQSGTVVSAKVVKDKISGDSKGFAFVEMENKEMASNAISTLAGQEVAGRAIRIDEAKPQTSSSGGSFRSAGNSDRRSGGGYGGGSYRNDSNSRSGSSRGNGFSGDRDSRRGGPSWR